MVYNNKAHSSLHIEIIDSNLLNQVACAIQFIHPRARSNETLSNQTDDFIM